MSITFRDYTDSDKPILLDMANKLAGHVKSLDPLKRIRNLPGYIEGSLEETLINVSKYRGRIILGEDKGAVVGFIIGIIWEQSQQNKLEIGPHVLGEVTDLYLEEEYRGQGLGTAMLEKIEIYFKSQGCDSMWVSVFEHNKQARGVYRKFGFVEREIGMLKQI